MMTRFVVLLLAASAALAVPVQAQAKAEPSTFPELALEQLLPPIIGGLKRTVPDAYSVRDLTLCPAQNIKLNNGRPTSWIVRLAFNSRNESGGYTGLVGYGAFFKAGRLTQVLRTSPVTKDPLNDLINRGIVNRFAECTSIPDDRVQTLLQTVRAL